MFLSTWPVLAALLGLLGLAGAALLLVGLRGRRIDDHPVCRQCGFDLIGTPEPRTECPECGADASRVRVGNRRKRGGEIVVGLLLLLVSLGLGGVGGYAAFTHAKPNTLKPTWWLVMETGWDEAGCTAQLQELAKRQLSDAQADTLVQRALAIQGDTSKPWLAEWGAVVERRRKEGKLSDPDWERFIVQGPQIELIVRPRVQRGQPLPVMVRISGRTGTASVNYDAGFGTVSIDGQPRRDMTLGGFGGAVGPNGSSGSRTYFDSNRIGEPLALGSRTARVVVPVQFRGQFDSHTIKRDIELTCAFEVVGESTVTAIRDDALRDALVAATKVQLNWWPPNGGEIPLGVSLDFKDLPATLSHDVWLRADGNETLFTTVAMPKGARMTFGGPGPTPAGDVVDVIFRPNPSVAEKSHALFEYWDGEFVIEGVKVPPKPAPDAAE